MGTVNQEELLKRIADALENISESLDSINGSLSDVSLSLDSLDKTLSGCICTNGESDFLCITGDISTY